MEEVSNEGNRNTTYTNDQMSHFPLVDYKMQQEIQVSAVVVHEFLSVPAAVYIAQHSALTHGLSSPD